MDKRHLRRQIKSRLQDMDPDLIRDKSHRICDFVAQTEAFRKASVVMAYLAIPQEADLSRVMLYAWQQGKVVAAPRVEWEKKHMLAVEIQSMDAAYSRDVSGLRNPLQGRPVPMEDIDLILTPGLAFDDRGGRLGRGGGYYDRFLHSQRLKATVCGIGFSEQKVASVPMEPHDRYMDIVITDEGNRECRRHGGE
ncbi:MAG: 5-formyltetrahydrofolate cyclo-ligase [Sedimentisphaerales bacterium]|nr:5-formyltetrahydrofolate cyclo-ligase [Sedimentisphaerales bacterium]